MKDNTGFIFNGSSTNSSRDGVQVRNRGIFPSHILLLLRDVVNVFWHWVCGDNLWLEKEKKKESCSLSFAMCGEKYIYCFLSLHNSYIQTMPHSAYRKKNKALFLVKGLRRLIWWCVLDCRHRWEKHQKGKTRRIGNGSSWGKGTVPIEPEFWFFLFLVISHSAKRWISCYSPVTNCSPFLGNRARKR